MAKEPGRDSRPALQRVIRVVTLLNDAGTAGLSAEELVQAAGYVGEPENQRTMLKRDLRGLEDAGWRVHNTAPPGAPAHYSLEAGDPRIRLVFTDAERGELRRVARLAGVPDRLVSESVVRADAEESDLRITVERSPAYNLSLIHHAHEHRILLHFTYRGIERAVSTDAVTTSRRHWYVRGRETQGDRFAAESKTFRLDRITELWLDRPGTAGPAVGDPDVNLDPLTFVDGDKVDAVVRTHAEYRTRVERALGRATEVEREGESLTLTIPVVSHLTVRHRLYELGARVHLVGPESLREEVRADLRAHLGGGS